MSQKKIIFFIVFVFLFSTLANAESLTVTVTSDKEDVVVGDKFFLVVTLSPNGKSLEGAELIFSLDNDDFVFNEGDYTAIELRENGNVYSQLGSNQVNSGSWLMSGSSGTAAVLADDKKILGKIPVEAKKVGEVKLELVSYKFVKETDMFGGETIYDLEGDDIVQGVINIGEGKDPVCGNNIVEAGETCDGDDLAGKTCASLFPNKPEGTLTCADGCSSFIVDDCESIPSDNCGNGVIDEGETCDGDDLAGKTCASLFPNKPEGTLTCADGCSSFIVDDCESIPSDNCGNGVIDEGETCDGDDLDGKTCADVYSDTKPEGILTCSVNCKSFSDTLCEPLCVPNCVGECGLDGCGGICGTCNEGENCVDQTCVADPAPKIVVQYLEEYAVLEAIDTGTPTDKASNLFLYFKTDVKTPTLPGKAFEEYVIFNHENVDLLNNVHQTLIGDGSDFKKAATIAYLLIGGVT
jgi:hypothetical protein